MMTSSLKRSIKQEKNPAAAKKSSNIETMSSFDKKVAIIQRLTKTDPSTSPEADMIDFVSSPEKSIEVCFTMKTVP